MTATADNTQPARATGARAALADPSARWMAAGVLVALAVRVAWALYVGHHAPTGFYDPVRYLGYANQIAKGKGFTEPLTGQATAYYPPGYPWFLGI
ncbi:MAG: hypothetical protein JWM05_701, partial [Acidimicrobiales bacterium]|nr:hypothetical protein [Acidimicrobiales bacterium]